ncbi:nucleotide exchange factor GrpE [Pandoraea sp.]|uniref:nucleotide exchange factor GrpE n=1 Tax=Pandoraea sp. TaxID=1883445 RepID=UPI00121BC3E7|nr:nucleotide exchange factor GrpE [Pandoraea sp.]TAL56593.1 MAG: nucleotide exchange factor GrpE [Pandoraea sp.]TAM15414.1 MAG: nucleotide exchange factor GrpE [Pandoraea sp.]
MKDQHKTSEEQATPQDAAAQQPAASPETTSAAPVATLEEQLAMVQAKADEYYDQLLRTKAESENVRRRAHEDIAKAHKFAVESFAEHLLPVADSLEAALADTSSDVAKVREGVELTLRQLLAAFEKSRVKVIDPVGAKFDPHQHQAISMVPAAEQQEPNTVVAVLQKGYLIADRVLRPALVTVAQGK